jgi:DNA repair protein RadA
MSLQTNQFSFEMQSAFQHYIEHKTTLKMTTGSSDLDSLIDAIQEGMFYLFYGNNSMILDAMVYRFLVNCVLPIKQKHGFESMGVFLNNVNYYDYYYSRTKTSASINPEKIGVAAKCSGIDPKIVFKNLYILTAYNQNHQLSIAEQQVIKLIESNKEDIKLLVIHNLTRFFKGSIANKKVETANILKQVIGMICKVCAKNKVALVCTADSNITSSSIGIIPKPTGGLYLKHAANVIVHIKEQFNASTTTIPSFKATLLKHQYIKTPKSAILYIKKTGGVVLLD